MQAKVKYPANAPRQTKRGPRINAVVILPDGTETTFWGDPGDPLISALKKGQAVEVFQDKKGNYQLDASSIQAAAAPPQQTAPSAANPAGIAGFSVPPPEVRQNMIDYIEFSGKMYRHCFNEAGKSMHDLGMKDEDLRAIATTLYLSAVRRFDLQ